MVACTKCENRYATAPQPTHNDSVRISGIIFETCAKGYLPITGQRSTVVTATQSRLQDITFALSILSQIRIALRQDTADTKSLFIWYLGYTIIILNNPAAEQQQSPDQFLLKYLY